MDKQSKITIIVVVTVIVAAGLFAGAYFLNKRLINSTNSFAECVKRGFPVMESYPRQCRAGDKTFVEEISGNKIEDNANKPVISPDCKIAGCSGQLCIDKNAEDAITTCEYRTEYACYKSARCEKQTDGRCGWTETEQLIECIQKVKNTLP